MKIITSKLLIATTALVLVLGAYAARAEDMDDMAKMDHSQMGHSMMMQNDGIYGSAMKTMHEGMASVKQTGDADVDFVTGMIPHHQGAIDMAKIVLEKGKNPEIKKLAEGIVKAQESEIKMMNDWLASHKK